MEKMTKPINITKKKTMVTMVVWLIGTKYVNRQGESDKGVFVAHPGW